MGVGSGELRYDAQLASGVASRTTYGGHHDQRLQPYISISTSPSSTAGPSAAARKPIACLSRTEFVSSLRFVRNKRRAPSGSLASRISAARQLFGHALPMHPTNRRRFTIAEFRIDFHLFLCLA